MFISVLVKSFGSFRIRNSAVFFNTGIYITYKFIFLEGVEVEGGTVT
jgi:hypothetical protein